MAVMFPRGRRVHPIVRVPLERRVVAVAEIEVDLKTPEVEVEIETTEVEVELDLPEITVTIE